MDEEIPQEFPISGELDLHTFRPSDIGSLIPEYLLAAREKGFSTVRIVHGKGSGALRKGVHALLEDCDLVARFSLCGEGDGGWGATRVWLSKGCTEPDASDRAAP